VFTSILRGDWAEAWEGVQQIVSGARDIIVGVVKDLLNTLRFVLGVVWEIVSDPFKNALDAVVDFFLGLPGRILLAIAGLPDLMFDAGVAAGKQLVAGVGKAASGVLGKILNPANIGLDLLGKIPGFDSGGVIPGPIGAPRLVVAHGGETVLPTPKTGGGGVNVTMQIYGQTDQQSVMAAVNSREFRAAMKSA